MSIPEADAQLPLKKRARRRLVGAIAMAVFAAVVLPMVMDPTPQAPVNDVEIRIPGQDQAPAFNPKALAAKPAEAPAARNVPAEKPVLVEKPLEKPAEKVVEKAVEKVSDKPAEKVVEKAAAKPAEKAPEKAATPAKPAAEKAAEKPAEKPAPEKAKAGGDDSRRAAAILAGKPEVATAAASDQHVILIGAFANPANVKQLQSKLGELGIKIYTEALDSPQGKKTRVRAGPFPSREAAEKALDRMKRIGVNGVVATKQ